MTLAEALTAIAIASASTPEAPGFEETDAYRAERLGFISEAIAGEARSDREAATMLATAIAESGLARDIDEGPCYRGPGYRERCDFGRSACVMQVHTGQRAVRDGWTREAIFADRAKCMAIAARVMRWSLSTCGDLTAYMAGRCGVEAEESARRMRHAGRILVALRAWQTSAND